MVGPARVDAAILVVVCSVILVAMTASHQLTPFAVIPFLAVFLLTGRLRLRFLPVLAVVLPVGWLLFAASAYLQGHTGQLFGSFGDVGANTLGALSTKVSGSDSHMFVVYTRMAEVALVWVLAIIGAITGYRRKTPWLTAAAGALAPLFLIPAQPYGGELLLRLYLFSLPFAACLAVLPLMSDKIGRRTGPGPGLEAGSDPAAARRGTRRNDHRYPLWKRQHGELQRGRNRRREPPVRDGAHRDQY